MSLACVIFLLPEAASGQYFGRNKVQYDRFDFQVVGTEHFDIHFYGDEREVIPDVARMAERWHERHTATFDHELSERKPLIFYANDADFQQTNVISGFIGVGTGGVTESLKQRVAMPLTGSYAETDHVLGHELVHSFQYDIALNDTTGLDLRLIPLWYVEGMAEYLSLGSEHPHTAMWLRDAALRDNLPSVEQLTREPQKYFPYRFGQAYAAYIGGKYGDATIPRLFKIIGQHGLDSAFVYVLGVRADSLSREWASEVKRAYLPLTEGRTAPDEAGKSVLSEETTGGEINVSPALSPDGRYVAFLSERDLFYINLFVADARTGEVVHELDRVGFDAHFDAIRFIKSAGAWSPDGRKLVFVTFEDGDNRLAILNVGSGAIERRIAVKGVGALLHTAWSPDGKTIAFSGMDDGITDLYLLDLETQEVRQLTDDPYADLQPAWSPDGQTLAFVTDRGPGGTDFETLAYGEMGLGLIDVTDGAIEVSRPFGDSMHHNPQFSSDGRSLFFISDQDGFKDIYRFSLNEETTYRITHLQTGVSGITELSPAMSVARQEGSMMFSVFNDGGYSVFSLEPASMRGEPVAAPEPVQAPAEGRASAAILPPHAPGGLVRGYLNRPQAGLPPERRSAGEVRDYDASLSLDYVAPPTLGVSVGGPFGTGLSGGVGLYFSDMLGNHNLGVVVSARGSVKDIGGEVSYMNRERRINYGASAGHIPLRFTRSFVDVAEDPETGEVTRRVTRITQRIFSDEANLVGSYPFSTTTRFDVSAGAVRYGFDYEADQFFVSDGRVRREEQDLQAPDPVYLAQISAAWVGDYSFFGFTSPLAGGRYRFEAAPLIGSANYVRLLADYRRYFFVRPISFAVRGLHVGNYGAQSGDPFSSQYLGFAYNLGFVRGYQFASFDADECTDTGAGSCAEIDRLTGTRIALASAEMRVPLFGTEDLGLVAFRFVPTELSFFVDAGVAWTAEEGPELKLAGSSTERIPVVSTGVSTRFNVFGQIVFELYFAHPFQRPEKDLVVGFTLAPGW